MGALVGTSISSAASAAGGEAGSSPSDWTMGLARDGGKGEREAYHFDLIML